MIKLNKLQTDTLAKKIARNINAERSEQRKLKIEELKNSDEVNNFINSIRIYIDGLNNDVLQSFSIKVGTTTATFYKGNTVDYVKEVYISYAKQNELNIYKSINNIVIEEELILSSIEATDLQMLIETITQKFI